MVSSLSKSAPSLRNARQLLRRQFERAGVHAGNFSKPAITPVFLN
jgi:hypothetical protein